MGRLLKLARGTFKPFARVVTGVCLGGALAAACSLGLVYPLWSLATSNKEVFSALVGGLLVAVVLATLFLKARRLVREGGWSSLARSAGRIGALLSGLALAVLSARYLPLAAAIPVAACSLAFALIARHALAERR